MDDWAIAAMNERYIIIAKLLEYWGLDAARLPPYVALLAQRKQTAATVAEQQRPALRVVE